MSKQSLTRYLYFLEEVKLSFLDCLLKRISLKESYFWISEIFYSGFIDECWQLIMKIYYDFYYLNNRIIETRIKKKYKKYNDIKSILSIVTALYQSDSDPYIFISRTNNKGRKTKDISKTLLNKLKKNESQSVYYYIDLLVKKDIDECIKVLEKFKGETFIDNELYKDKTHLLFAFACKKYTNKNIIVKFIKKNKEFITNINTPVNPVNMTLNNRRIYNISENIGCFNLFDNPKFDKKYNFCYKWEYYCKFSPLWKKRFNCEFKNKKPVFKTFDDEEEFYNKYNYESDEKCDLFLKYNKDSKLSCWLKQIYDGRNYEKYCYNSKITY
tara:strand:- start:46 stop:1026 length:981 start_codon:yes stop_codon:yes gene_type:complete